MMRKSFRLPPLFDEIPRSILKSVQLGAGEYLFHQGQKSNAFYMILEGKVGLVRHTMAGERVTLFRAQKGDLVAEASIFSVQYHCDGVSETESHVVGFNKAGILEHFRTNPEFALMFIERLTKQIQTYRKRLELMAIKSAKERVWTAFCDGWLTDSITEFAGSLGLSPEATYRALAELVREGKLQKSGYGQYAIERST